MFTVTRFCIQTFTRDPTGLWPAEAREFMFEEDARGAARAARRRSAGVALYSVRGEPVQRLWDRPRLLERHGDILELEPG